MSCVLCRFVGYVGQYILNWLNLLDHALNTLLLGDADETVSARTARARNAGQKWAKWFCNFLTWGQTVVTFGRMTRDHCNYAIDKNSTPTTYEIWNWSKMEIDSTPVATVEVIEKSNT